MSKLGASLLEDLLALETGHRGPRIEAGAGHQASFVGYRTKNLDTVLGPVTLGRAYYHCIDCGHGVAPKDNELGVAGASLSPGLRAMVARLGAAVMALIEIPQSCSAKFLTLGSCQGSGSVGVHGVSPFVE